MCVPFLEGQGRNQTIYDIYSEAFGNLTAAVLPQYSGTLWGQELNSDSFMPE